MQQVTGTDAQVDGGGTSKVEPPDYLSEGELHVFNKIKQELEPIRLEVGATYNASMLRLYQTANVLFIYRSRIFPAAADPCMA